MRITSQEFEQNGAIPARCTCDGGDVRPELRFEKVPEEAVTIAIIVDDPDASSETWVHWTAWNIPANVTAIAEDALPDGVVEGATSFGRPGYGGPCPPSGTHRYFFKAYALDAKLDIPPTTDAAGLLAAMEGHVLDKAGLIGTYTRD